MRRRRALRVLAPAGDNQPKAPPQPTLSQFLDAVFRDPPDIFLRVALDHQWLLHPFRITKPLDDPLPTLPVRIGEVEIGQMHLTAAQSHSGHLRTGPRVEIEGRVVPHPHLDGVDLLKALYAQITD